MTRTAALCVLLVLVVPAALAPLTDAQTPPAPTVPTAAPFDDTGVLPVDRAVNDGERTLAEANATLNETYGDAADELDPALSAGAGLVLFHDGTGEDPHTLPFTPWTVLGSRDWTPRPDAARAGDWGYASAALDDGTYGGAARSLLLTPELDLRTGFFDSGAGEADECFAQDVDPSACGEDCMRQSLTTYSSVYSLIFGPYGCLSEANTIRDSPTDPGAGGRGKVLPIGDYPPASPYELAFWLRHNLAQGKDGVQIRLYEERPSSSSDITTCSVSCIIATPIVTAEGDDYPVRSVAAAPNDASGYYTGFADWQEKRIDLSTWAGRSVWIGFYFVSQPIPSKAYFQSPQDFAAGAGFYGFQLDEFRVSAPAPMVSLRVRALTGPGTPLPNQALPTLLPREPAQVSTYLVNRGLSAIDLRAAVRLRAAGGSIVDEFIDNKTYSLEPGEILPYSHMFASPGNGSFMAEVQAALVGNQLDEADDSDNAAQRGFVVAEVRAVRFDPLARSLPAVASGERLTVSTRITNEGNVPEALAVHARGVDAATGTFVDGLVPTPQLVRPVTVLPGESTALSWDLETTQPGHYRLAVSTGPIEVDAVAQMLGPGGGLAMSSTFLAAGFDPPTQGDLSDAAWTSVPATPLELLDPAAPGVDVRNAQIQVVNTNETFYVGIRVFVPSCSGHTFELAALLDDQGDHQAPVSFMALQASRPCVVIQGRPTLTYLFSVGLAGSGGLATGPGDSVGLMMRLRDTDTGQGLTSTHRFPGAAFESDGGPGSFSVRQGDPPHGVAYDLWSLSFTSPDGGLGDELARWADVTIADHEGSGEATAHALLLSTGFGIDRSSPSYLDLHIGHDPCVVRGWAQVGVLPHTNGAGHGDVIDKWNCGEYPAAGRPVLYLGAAPGSFCGPRKCPPYNALGEGVPSTLMSPPVSLAADAADPNLWLYHQYSSGVTFYDGTIAGFDRGGLDVLGFAYVTVQVLNQTTGRWENPPGSSGEAKLLPAGGYDTERTTGIFDPRNGPLERHPASEDSCPGSRDSSQIDQRAYCGWWWPSGTFESYRGQDSPVVAGGTFEGSPWTLDKIPLVGTHVRSPATEIFLDLRGQTVRFLFTYMRAPAGLGQDHGWRIGAVSVTEGDSFVRDVEMANLSVATGHDYRRLMDGRLVGVGPNTSVPVNLTVRNVGRSAVAGYEVVLEGHDKIGGQALCGQTRLVEEALRPGETRYFDLTCDLAEGTEGALLALAARVDVAGGEDFIINNERVLAESVPVRSLPDAAVSVGAWPLTGPVDQERTLFARIRNDGTVPLSDFQVTVSLVRLTEAGAGVPQTSYTGHARGILPVGGDLPLDAPELALDPPLSGADFFFTPSRQATYLYSVRVSAGPEGDTDPANDAAQVKIRALSVLYGQDFENSEVRDPAVAFGTAHAEGTSDVWKPAPGGPNASRVRLLAGNATTDELPPGADAAYVLPTFDLTTVQSATLTFLQRYDLEDGFDGGRVEISTDGGQSWRPASALPQPLAGLPEGYPSTLLVGSNPLLENATQAWAAAYTGRSEDLPGPDTDGWFPAEFDLGADPAFRRTTAVEDLALSGFAAEPTQRVADESGAVQETHPSWQVDEPNARLRGRYWWIDNQAAQTPQAHSGKTMWWSGSAGPHAQNPVDGALALLVDVPDLERAASQATERLLFEWWDWRPGWQETAALDRTGTGGQFTSGVQSSLDPQRLDPVAVAVRSRSTDGWTQRAIDLTPWAGLDVYVVFQYTSVVSASNPFPIQQDNRGWFIDDISLTSYLAFDEGIEEVLTQPVAAGPSLDLESTLGQADWRVVQNPNRASWTLISELPAAAASAWHVASATLPGHGPLPAWSIARPGDQGYPHALDTRLVTPLVDLTSTVGRNASLEFDHRYDLEATQDTTAEDPFVRAVDGGVVEFQVFDEATGTYGPWTQLFGRAPPELVYFEESQDEASPPKAVSATLGDSRARVAATGYSALLDHGILPDTGKQSGYGAPFESYPGLRNHGGAMAGDPGQPVAWRMGALWADDPVMYLFSGDSDGWQHVQWDVSHLLGKRVRFGFHAWSNPHYGATDPLEGWTVANVRVRAEVFQGQPVQVRLRAGTDGSDTKGEWSVDNLLVVGQRFHSNLALLADAREIHAAPSTPVQMTGRVANLGTQGRHDLALAVRVLDHDTKASLPFTLSSPDAPALDLSGPVGQRALGPFALAQPGATLPFTVAISLPAPQSAYDVVLEVLQAGGEDGTSYARAPNDVPGNVFDTWTIESATRDAIEVVLPALAAAPALDIDPSPANEDQPVQVSGLLRNNGTTAPELAVRWTLVELHQKGAGSPAQNFTAEVSELVSSPTPTHITIQPGQTAPVQGTLIPPRPGVYRAILSVTADGTELARSSAEFMVDRSLEYYRADFDQAEDLQGWEDQSHPSLPPSLHFRASKTGLQWGATDAQFQQGRTYCNADGQDLCNTARPISGNQPGAQVVGPEGIALGPPIDLSLVPEGKAFLTVVHSANFAPGDGAVLELIPYRTPVDPALGLQPAFFYTDAGGSPTEPVGFVLDPLPSMEGSVSSFPSAFIPPPPLSPGNTGQTQPARINPLNPTPGNPPVQVFGGPFSRQASVFDLSQPADPLRPGSSVPPVVLLNYTIGIRIHVGITPHDPATPNAGGQGWTLHSVAVTSAGVRLDPDRLNLPLSPGLPKEIRLAVTNVGPGLDNVSFAMDATRSSVPPSWISFEAPYLELRPGETGTVSARLHIPADGVTPPGAYEARITASSGLDLNVQGSTALGLLNQPRLYPDLHVRLSTDAAETMFQVGTVAPVHATVTNVGLADSKPVNVAFHYLDASTGRTTPFGTASLPDLCPSLLCGPAASTATVTVEWTVPPAPGPYLLLAQVDPEGRLVQQGTLHEAVLPVEAIPLQLPDIVVSNLTLEGLGPDGVAEAGSLVVASVDVTNAGYVPASRVDVQLIDGVSEIAARSLEGLQPGETRNVTGVRVANGNAVILRATATSVDQNEIRVDNNEARLRVPVRTHDLRLEAPASNFTVAPGGSTRLLVNIHNQGNRVEQVFASVDQLEDDWTIQFEPNPAVIAPGATGFIQVRIEAPPAALAGTSLIGMRARSATNPNYQVVLGLPVQVTPGGAQASLEPDAPATAPGPAMMAVNVSNGANAPLEGLLFLEAPAWQDDPLRIQVGPFGRQTFHVPLVVPPDAALGTTATALRLEDLNGTVLATSMTTIDVLSGVRGDANWVGPGVPRAREAPLGGSFFEYPLTVTNTGNTPFHVRLVPRDLSEGASSVEIAPDQPVLPGTTIRRVVAVEVAPDGLPRPLGHVEAWALAEGNETLLLANLPLPGVSVLPDLRIERVDQTPLGQVQAGQPVTFTITLVNEGGRPAPASRVFAFRNGDLVAAAYAPRVPAGQRVEVETAFGFATAGPALVVFVADGGETINETSKENNAGSLQVEILPRDRLPAVPSAPLALAAVVTLGAAWALGRTRRGGAP